MAQYKKYSSIGKDENEQDLEDSTTEVPRITSQEDRDAIIERQMLVVIDNYTDWCGPCKMCAPQYAALHNKYSKPGVCVLVKENVEDAIPGVTENVRGVPCFHFYVNGMIQPNMTVTGGDVGVVEQTIQQVFENMKKTQ